MSVLSNNVTVPVKLTPATFRTLRAIADRKGCQVHHLLEHLAVRATTAPTPAPTPTPAPAPGVRAKPPTRDSVRRLHTAGHCDRAIADKLHISVNLVIQHRLRMGLRANPDPKRPEITVTGEYAERVVALARTGMSDQAIADQVGGSRETVRTLRCAAGIKRHPGRKPHTNNEGTAA